MRRSATRPAPIRQRLAELPTELWTLTSLLFVVTAVLSILILGAISVLAGLRAYVGGEGLYSKGQKDATAYLLRYAESQEPAEYAEFLAAIAVPLADRDARLALERDPPDVDAARAAFIRGRNDPGDVDDMILLFRYFRWVGAMQAAIAIWEQGDAGVERLLAQGEELHAAIQSGDATRARVAEILARVHATHTELSVQEDRFSLTLSRGAQQMERRLVGGGALAAALLLLATGTTIWRLLGRVLESNLRYRRLLETARDAIFVTDAGTGRIVEANSQAAALCGVAQQRLPGRLLDDVLPALASVADDAPATGSAPVREFRLYRDGIDVPVEVSTGATEVGGRRILQTAVRDVSERKRFEEALERARRLESLDRFAGGIAHEFNNLLSVILATARAGRDDAPPGAPVRDDFGDIEEAADKAAMLVSQLMLFARRQRNEPVLIDLDASIRSLAGALDGLASEAIQLSFEPSGEPLPIRADPVHVELLLRNLVSNACDALPEGGAIQISTRREEGGDRDVALLRVRDSGVGMAPEVREQVFEPFFTTKEVGAGTGLGLATCYGIVEHLGGSIEVDTEPGRGTTFEVRLPLAADAA